MRRKKMRATIKHDEHWNTEEYLQKYRFEIDELER